MTANRAAFVVPIVNLSKSVRAALSFVLATSSCASDEPIAQSANIEGVYMQCDGTFAGTTVTIMPGGQLELNFYGDDGAWDLRLGGEYVLARDVLSAQVFEVLSELGAAPQVNPEFEIYWVLQRNRRETILILSDIVQGPFGRPWLESGSRSSRSQAACR